ncbi:hypothetical protein GCM10011309_06260 [Litorimonas cladophorae]|uniref:Uncharacterized protein n=1 Tax=Litorimonas cladophorae TaxID=1220491 RepID=A0A918KFQ5_9PROT|nr:hypothetical protein GCM10011309_06260 [Litorimonas cladophorae]
MAALRPALNIFASGSLKNADIAGGVGFNLGVGAAAKLAEDAATVQTNTKIAFFKPIFWRVATLRLAHIYILPIE